VPTEIIDLDVRPTAVDGLLVLRMKQVADERGTVREAFRASAYAAAGVGVGPWAQINVTESAPGAIRGLHGEAIDKLVAVAHGRVFAAYLDLREGSVTRGTVVTVELGPGDQVFVPAGVCNGFQSLGDSPTQYLYCFTQEWRPGMPGVAVSPLDPALGIAWPVPVRDGDLAQVSAKDRSAPLLAEVL
jgi:dTDP-4-dehydrorhamnose 3,5-epimerase